MPPVSVALCKWETRLVPRRCKSTLELVKSLATNIYRASLVKEAYQKCPKTKVVMSGYSQGAMLVHNAAKSLPADTTSKIAAVVNFGDPCKSPSASNKTSETNSSIVQRQAIQGVPSDRVKIICHTGDGVCAGTAAITPDHLTYSQDANTAAQFVVSKVK